MEIDIYGTVIKQIKIDVPPNIVDYVYKVKENSVGKKRSNRGGWQSEFYNERSFEWMIPVINQVQQIAGKTGSITYWFNVNGPGHYNELHDHGDFGTNTCGCLYIQVPPYAGGITFQQVGGKKTTTIMMDAGDLILFPDNIKHSVAKNQSNYNRVSVAFNFWKMVK